MKLGEVKARAVAEWPTNAETQAPAVAQLRLLYQAPFLLPYNLQHVPTTYRLVLTTDYSLHVTYVSLHTTRYTLLATHYSPTTHCRLHTTHYSSGQVRGGQRAAQR